MSYYEIKGLNMISLLYQHVVQWTSQPILCFVDREEKVGVEY